MPTSLGCICPQDVGSRECYDLRYFGYSPRLRDDDEFFEPDDGDGDCECICHVQVPDDDTEGTY